MTLVLGLDAGGTKMAAGLVRRDGEVVGYVREDTPQSLDAEHVWETVCTVLDRVVAEEGDGYEAVGIGCGGGRAGSAAESVMMAALTTQSGLDTGNPS